MPGSHLYVDCAKTDELSLYFTGLQMQMNSAEKVLPVEVCLRDIMHP